MVRRFVDAFDAGVADLPRSLKPDGAALSVPVGDDLREALRAYEKAHIQAVLAKAEHDKKLAAEMLGVSLSSLYRKIEELSIGLDSRGAGRDD